MLYYIFRTIHCFIERNNQLIKKKTVKKIESIFEIIAVLCFYPGLLSLFLISVAITVFACHNIV